MAQPFTDEHRDNVEHIETTPERARQGMKDVDIVVILAVSTFLAAIGLTIFFISTSVAH